MPIRFACPICQTSYTVDDSHAGRKGECKKCGQRLQIPTPQSSAQALANEQAPVKPPPLPVRKSTVSQKPRTPRDWWLYTPRNERTEAVSWDMLRSMAHAGKLKRRHFIKQKGERRWHFAGRYRDLWPPTLLTAEASSLLTSCSACLGQIAKEAPACPKCGAPNIWIHPECLRFFDRLRMFERIYPGFEAQTQGFCLVCRSVRDKQFLDYAANAVGSMGFMGSFSLGGLASVLAASIGSQYAAQALRDQAGPGVHAFVIDFRCRKPVWSSTDDELWEAVLDFFDVI